jgi:Domain of unknown function (DU1801)
MVEALDHFYLSQPEPIRGCLLALRDIVLAHHPEIVEAWKCRMPFFGYRGKLFCYLWVDKTSQQPYLGIVEGRRIEYPGLVLGQRARMKTIPFDPNENLPLEAIVAILRATLDLYLTGVVKTKQGK